jgi:hypothetical protein
MKREWLYHTILRTASLVAPGDQRADWLDGWRSDLWYVPRRGATRFCLGAFRDALWLRRNNPNPRPGIGIHVESPLSCLGLLAILAAICLAIMVHVPCAGLESPGGIGDFARGMAGMLILSFGLLAATRAAMGRSGREPHPMTWRARLRLGIFLALKIALIQPILLCGLLVCSALAPVGAMGLWAFWALPCHWVLKDQQRRCPVCLRLLTDPVRIGSASRTFLEWYGAESTCSRGHGLLHCSETSASYAGEPEWLCLGDSWSGLFSETAGVRQR